MLKILGRPSSANVHKVMWLCDELKIPHTREDYGGSFGKTKEPAYLSMNPNALVPTIDDDGFILWESNSICRYLANKYGANATIYPKDPKQRASCERWQDWQLSVLAPAHGPAFVGLIRTPPEKRDMNAINAGRERFSAAIKILDTVLAKNKFINGNDLTLADISNGSFVYRWFTLDMKREDYPNAKRYFDELSKRDGFKKHVAIGLS